MKNRRRFLKTSACGIFASMLATLPELTFAKNTTNKAIVKQMDEGETYFVRENTPITIKISSVLDKVESVSICTEEIIAGDGIPVHKHLYNDEYFFFHKGTSILIIENEKFPVTAGTTAYVPKGVWHGLRNDSAESLLFSFGYSPAGFEDFFRQIGTLKGSPFRAKSRDEVLAIARKYGMVFK